MIFDEIPLELKEHIFTYVTPNDWVNTAKVSTEWMDLTLGCIKKIESCHLLILHHLAEFINQQHNTSYSWASLLTLMPRLVHLECFENTEAFWQEIRPICHQLKILDYKPRKPRNATKPSFDWNKLDISFDNLVEAICEEYFEGRVSPPGWFAYAPQLEKLTLRYVKINAKWKKSIPRTVKHIILDRADFADEPQCSINYLFQDTSAMETFSMEQCMHPRSVSSKFFDETPRLKKLELISMIDNAATSRIVKKALRNCQGLETVKADGVFITDSWQRLIPENVKSLNFSEMNVQEHIRRDFSLDWLFHNYYYLQSLRLKWVDWTGFDSQKFYLTENLTKLTLDNYMSYFADERDDSVDPFSDICVRMIPVSHLIDVKIYGLTIHESWRHIFPSTVRRLKLKNVHLSKEAQLFFSPQFICENPSKIESLKLINFEGDLPAMDLNAFTGMQVLQDLRLKNIRLSTECLQSILTHCSALTNLFIREWTADALINIPRNLVLPSLRELQIVKPVDQPHLLLQHFPKVRTVDIAIVSSDEYFPDIWQAMVEVETAAIAIRHPTWHLVRSLIETIGDVKIKYFCLTYECKVVSVFLTNSLLDACSKLNDVLIFREPYNVLQISDNYPTSPLLRRNVSRIPSSMDELSQRYHEIVAAEMEYSDDSDDSDDDW